LGEPEDRKIRKEEGNGKEERKKKLQADINFRPLKHAMIKTYMVHGA